MCPTQQQQGTMGMVAFVLIKTLVLIKKFL
jgi:hypothetical protein